MTSCDSGKSFEMNLLRHTQQRPRNLVISMGNPRIWTAGNFTDCDRNGLVGKGRGMVHTSICADILHSLLHLYDTT